jgi:hypothetical protein
MKKVPSLKKRNDYVKYWSNNKQQMGVSIGKGNIEGDKTIKKFYRRIIKEHFYLGWRSGKYDKVSKRLNEIRQSPQHVNKIDGKSFILQQESLLLFLTETIDEEQMNNLIAMIESEDTDNIYIAEIAISQLSLKRAETLGKASPNTKRGLENYAYAKKHYYNQIMPNAERIMNSHEFDYAMWDVASKYIKK